jgi:hypothetical protein
MRPVFAVRFDTTMAPSVGKMEDPAVQRVRQPAPAVDQVLVGAFTEDDRYDVWRPARRYYRLTAEGAEQAQEALARAYRPRRVPAARPVLGES